MLIDWEPLLEKVGGKVNFSTFSDTFKECFCDVVLSSLGLPENRCISVDWKVKENCFMIDLFVDPTTVDTLDFILEREICYKNEEVYPVVKKMIRKYYEQ